MPRMTFKCFQTMTLGKRGLVPMEPPIDFTSKAFLASNGDLYINIGHDDTNLDSLFIANRDMFELEFNVTE